MRNESKRLQARVDELKASDERTASTLQNLISWIDTLSRAIETQREENKRACDRTADILNGELETLRKELSAVVDKLRGDEEPATVVDFEMVEESKVLNFSAAGE